MEVKENNTSEIILESLDKVMAEIIETAVICE